MTTIDLNLQAVTDAIREQAQYMFHSPSAMGSFALTLDYAGEYEFLPTFLKLDIDGTAFKATLLRYDRGTGRASYGLEIL